MGGKPLFHVSAHKKSNGYISCYHRKNVPRISVMVCEHNCRFKANCQEYKMFFDLHSQDQLTFIANQNQVG